MIFKLSLLVDKPGHKISLPLLLGNLLIQSFSEISNAFQYNLNVRMSKLLLYGRALSTSRYVIGFNSILSDL